ncbi:MAG: MFS transporter [Chloroflexi bacterium]|uniref:MFS transporter n=1 Tax=Candidatus Chlorohelix allophototropha TaxID=3003348 RepID=A0A8T7M7W5_9CHLR|nr:MFS transporter [Chloroflexota bacterium]WJW68163.1 MFS transporter [Chloroflexota bacterium L227-S17]
MSELATKQATEKKPTVLATWSWATYDLANTIYSAAIISIYFPAWVKNELKIEDIWYALPMSISMLIVGVFSPLLGALSDRGGNRMKWLGGATILSIGALFLMGVAPALGAGVAVSLGSGIIFFIVANVGYQSALMFYDSLLPSVSTTSNWGKVSGLGVGLGYFGGIIGFLGVGYLGDMLYGAGALTGDNPKNSDSFFIAAILYLLFSIPCFIFVRERHYKTEQEAAKLTFTSTMTQTLRTFKQSMLYPGLFVFLVANFFYSDALNTVITAMGIYSTEVIGFSPSQRNGFLAFATIFAVVGSIIFGFVADKIGSKQALNISLSIWVVVFVIAMAAPPRDFFFWIGGPLAGIALGSTWVSARTLMVELTPPERLGEFMGLYNLTGKFSAVLGPVLWGGTLLLFNPNDPKVGNLGYQIAVGTLLAVVIIGFVIHQFVPAQSTEVRKAYSRAEIDIS